MATKVEFKRVQTDAEVENIDIKDGQLIYTGTGKTFMDYGNQRIPTGSGGSSVTVDTEMSDTSENAVQNKVIKEYVDSQTVPEEVIVSDTQPSGNDWKLWIDSDEVGSQASEITNSYSESTGLGYSANYVNNNFATKDYVQNDTISYLHIFKKGHFVMVMGYLRVNADNKTITLPYKSKYKIEVPAVGFNDVSSNPQGYGYGKVEANSNSMVFKFNVAVTEAPLNFVYYTDDED